MNETLTDLAVEYGWGCPECKGERFTIRALAGCKTCHGNRVTPSDADRFMDEVAAVVTQAAWMQEAWDRDSANVDGSDWGHLRQSLDSLQRKAE